LPTVNVYEYALKVVLAFLVMMGVKVGGVTFCIF